MTLLEIGPASLFFANSPQPTCIDAADANDDGDFNLTDAVYTLNALDCERYHSC